MLPYGAKRRPDGRVSGASAEPLGHAERLGDLPRRPVRDADVSHQPLLDQRVERTQRLLHRRGDVESVHLVEIDMIELEPLQAGLDGLHDVIAREPSRVRALAHLAEHLGRDDHIVARDAEIAQRLTSEPLRLSLAVDVRRVDEIDAGIEGTPHQSVYLGLLQLTDPTPDVAIAAAKRHRAQTQLGDEEPVEPNRLCRLKNAPLNQLFSDCMSITNR